MPGTAQHGRSGRPAGWHRDPAYPSGSRRRPLRCGHAVREAPGLDQPSALAIAGARASLDHERQPGRRCPGRAAAAPAGARSRVLTRRIALPGSACTELDGGARSAASHSDGRIGRGVGAGRGSGRAARANGARRSGARSRRCTRALVDRQGLPAQQRSSAPEHLARRRPPAECRRRPRRAPGSGGGPPDQREQRHADPDAGDRQQRGRRAAAPDDRASALRPTAAGRPAARRAEPGLWHCPS